MRIGRMIAPVHTLGPGKRVCLWMQGCGKDCPGCVSPELRPTEGPEVETAVLEQVLRDAADRNDCKGLTISGGEPFDQPEELAALLERLKDRFSDIMVYTGYTLARLREMENEAVERILGLVDVLIDGPYIRERNVRECVLRGSDNQTIYYFNPALREEYEEYLRQGRTVETFVHNGIVIRVGILNER